MPQGKAIGLCLSHQLRVNFHGLVIHFKKSFIPCTIVLVEFPPLPGNANFSSYS
uniref:Uncharacterized protein n=1 Tax=Tetranychus urticae TaxID=32264 RepID=T1L2I8_TETUR